MIPFSQPSRMHQCVSTWHKPYKIGNLCFYLFSRAVLTCSRIVCPVCWSGLHVWKVATKPPLYRFIVLELTEARTKEKTCSVFFFFSCTKEPLGIHCENFFTLNESDGVRWRRVERIKLCICECECGSSKKNKRIHCGWCE